MRWLVTVDAKTDLDEIKTRLHAIGCTKVDTDDAIPLDEHQVAVPVEGPPNLGKLVEADPVLVAAYNDSEQSPY